MKYARHCSVVHAAESIEPALGSLTGGGGAGGSGVVNDSVLE